MKPFLFLGIRAEDDAADGEYAAVLKFSGLDERHVHRHRIERDELGPVDLDSLSGIVLGGGPWNVSDPEEGKPAEQRRGEARLRQVALQVVEADFPFLGACYGVGTLGAINGGIVDRTWSEPIGAITIRLTPEGASDQLLGAMSQEFSAFVGHKEAIRRLPNRAVRLAESDTCPYQAFRLGTRVYATQFHPELDLGGVVTRVDAYRHHGYFEPHEGEEIIRQAEGAQVSEPPRVLTRFVELFARG